MDGYLTNEQVADRLGIKRGSIHQYRQRPGFPPPDEKIGRTPVWKTETIEAWEKARPGRGWRKGKTKADSQGGSPSDVAG